MRLSLGFLAGMLCGILTATIFFLITRPVPVVEQHSESSQLSLVSDAATKLSSEAPTREVATSKEQKVDGTPVAIPTLVKPDVKPALLIPVYEIEASQLTDSFTQPRNGGRRHHAIDIMAPEDTPVVAVNDGKVVRMFESDDGGLAIYQFDPSERQVYYYAHLEDYASNLYEGKQVKRGDVIGYVGSTGNADSDYPHLHFAISELGPGKRWWKGKAINPYPLLTGQQASK